MRYQTKKGQFIVISFMFVLLLLLFIYSLETDNTYISSNWENSIVLSAMEQTCYIGKMANGTYIQASYNELESFVSQYCNQRVYDCSLLIENNTVIPPSGNFSLLNYTHFDYQFEFELNGLSQTVNFTC